MKDVTSTEELLRHALETAISESASLEVRTAAEAETESDTLTLTASFRSGGPSMVLSLGQLISVLEDQAQVGSIDLHGPPESRLTLFGTHGPDNFRIVIEL